MFFNRRSASKNCRKFNNSTAGNVNHSKTDSCFTDRFNFFRALADVLYIYPLKKDKKTFDANKEELGFASKTKNQGKQAIEDIPPDRLTEEQKIGLEQEAFELKSKSLLFFLCTSLTYCCFMSL